MPVQTISLECRVDGRVVPNVLEVTCSAGFDQINAEATIYTTVRPAWADEGQRVTIYATNTGTASGQIFGGEVVSFDWSFAPGKVGIVCGDLLARTREAWGGDEYEYVEQDDAEIIRNLLEKKAIPSSAAHIESSSWTLGVIMPIVLKEGDTPYSIIEQIDDLAGFKTFSLTSGVIWRQRVSGAPGGSGALTFQRGVQILADARRTRSKLGIINRCIVTGVDYEGLTVGGPGIGEASSPNPYVSDPSGFVTETIQSNLVEDDAKALEIAERRVNDKNRRPEGLSLSVPLEPRVQPGMTVQVIHDDLETGSALVFVQNVSHTIGSGGARTALRTTGGFLGGLVLQPPVANFLVQTFREGRDTGSGVESIVVVVADGSGSYDPDGTIASYAWSIVVTGGTADPETGSEPTFRTVVDGAPTEITVTLTVTDNDALTGTLPLTVPIDTTTMQSEAIYVAYGVAACSVDGEQNWQEQTPASGSATCLCAIAPSWGQAWGTSTGHVYATFDRLASPLIDLGTPHGAVACTAVWCHETDNTRLWAAFADGAVYLGAVDVAGQSATWSHAGDIGAGPVVEIRESYGLIGELRATAGAGYYYSTNGGATWSLVHTFDTASRMAAGFNTNLAAGLNDPAPIYDEDGAPPTVPGGVEHIRGISFGYRAQELYAADDAAQLYLGPGPSFDLSLHTDTTAAIVNHMIRSGNIDRVVYMAVGDGSGSNGFQKWIPGAASPFFIKQTGTAAGLMIGYGQLGVPPREASLLMVQGGSFGSGGVKKTTDSGATWIDVSGDLPAAAWAGITASPLNANHWIVWNATTAYRTTNAGVNWTAITGLATGLTGPMVINSFEFSPDSVNKWTAVGSRDPGFAGHGWVSRGDGNAATATTYWPVFGGLLPPPGPADQGFPTSVVYASGDDIIVACDEITDGVGAHVKDGRWVYFPAGSLSGRGTAIGDLPIKSWAINPGVSRSQIVGAARDPIDARGDVYMSGNYTTTAPTLFDTVDDGTISTILASTTSAIYVASGSGIYQLAYVPGDPVVVALTSGRNIVFARSDRQTRTAVAALAESTVLLPAIGYYFDGATWSTFTPPGAFTGTSVYAPFVEVIT